MKRQFASKLVGTHFLFECGWVVPYMDGETVDDTLYRIYGSFVDKYIKECEPRTKLLESGDLRIRKRALRSKVKARYLRSNRTRLIKYLKDKNTPFKASRIAYQLNWQYAESVGPQDVCAAVLKE